MRYRENSAIAHDARDRCAVADFCEGLCRDQHLQTDGMRCPAWYTDDMDKRKKRSRKKGRGRRR